MKKKIFSQEGLKVLACVTMLIDHIGATLYPNMWLRAIGRLALPIYCFLLVEGVWHTRDTKKYVKRLLIGGLLSEIPFEILFFGELTWTHQSIMMTLILGLIAVFWGRRKKSYWLPFALCFFAAEFLNTDYGGWGVALICMFAVTEEMPHKKLLQFAGTALVFWCMDSVWMSVGRVIIPMQFFGMFALIPIWLYSGKKLTHNRAAQWAFYLFYPVHLVVLLLLTRL